MTTKSISMKRIFDAIYRWIEGPPTPNPNPLAPYTIEYRLGKSHPYEILKDGNSIITHTKERTDGYIKDRIYGTTYKIPNIVTETFITTYKTKEQALVEIYKLLDRPIPYELLHFDQEFKIKVSKFLRKIITDEKYKEISISELCDILDPKDENEKGES